MAEHKGSKDMKPQGKSHRTGRGLASPGGSGTPPAQDHQAAGVSDRTPEQRGAQRTTAGAPSKRR